MVQKSRLDNGIRVVTEKIPAIHSATIGFWVENGSRHESKEQSGISHFIEHMLFKGSQRRSALEIAKEIDAGGGVLNAFTSREFSCYYAKVLAGNLPRAIDLLSDIVLNSVFDLDELEKERRVILQEIYMDEDTPDEQIHDLFCQSFWASHPLGHSILGTRETVGSLCREDLLGFMAERYCGQNLLVCAAGEVDHQQIVDAIATAFSGVPKGAATHGCDAPRYRRQICISPRELEQVHICLGTRSLPQNHPNRFAAYLLNAILGGSMSSRLFQCVREERGLAYAIYSYLCNHSDSGALVVYAGTSPQEAQQVVRLILDELRRLRDEPVAEDELDSAREQLRGSLLLSLESSDNRMTRLAKNEIYMGRHVGFKEVLAGFNRVGREDIQRLAEFILKDDYLTLQLVGKAAGGDFPLIDLTLG